MKSWKSLLAVATACVASSAAPVLASTRTNVASILALLLCAGSLAVLTAGSRRGGRLAGEGRPAFVPGIQSASRAVAPVGSTTADHRLERVRRLASQHLRSYTLTENTLRLSYDRDAADDVEGVVAIERKCCAFLDFRVTRRDAEIELTIVGPATPGPQARWLLSRFLADRMQLPIRYEA